MKAADTIPPITPRSHAVAAYERAIVDFIQRWMPSDSVRARNWAADVHMLVRVIWNDAQAPAFEQMARMLEISAGLRPLVPYQPTITTEERPKS